MGSDTVADEEIADAVTDEAPQDQAHETTLEPTDDPQTQAADAGEDQRILPRRRGRPKGSKNKVKASARVKATRAVKAKTARPRQARDGVGRVHQAYRLADGIPDSIPNPSAARTILKALHHRGTATKQELAQDLGQDFPDPTLRFNLWKLRLAEIIVIA